MILTTFGFFVLTILTIRLKDKKVALRSYELTKWERSIKNSFQVFKELLDHLKCGIGLGLVFWTLPLLFSQVYSIPFFLHNCISVLVLPRSVLCSCGDQDQHSWCRFFQGVVCVLEGFKITIGVRSL